MPKKSKERIFHIFLNLPTSNKLGFQANIGPMKINWISS